MLSTRSLLTLPDEQSMGQGYSETIVRDLRIPSTVRGIDEFLVDTSGYISWERSQRSR